MRRLLLSILLFDSILFSLVAQPKNYSASELKLAIKKLNVLQNVLYIAAHPDDENTRLITYFANERLCQTAYLSITRGDGGQNLIGTETGDLMGVLRTQELLEARKIDGGQQFFTRAIDFGYSKSSDETLEKWDKEKILADVVWVIRKFKPDIIITRFPEDGDGGHGHHSASAILAREAFEASGNKKKFPDQLKYIEPWQPKRLLFNASTWWKENLAEIASQSDEYTTVDVGVYNPLLGMAYTEIASESRSMHKSQGFGSMKTRGETIEYLKHISGEKAIKDPLDGIEPGWGKINGSEHLSILLQKAYEDFNSEKPETVIPTLIRAYKELLKLNDTYWVDVKKRELEEIILGCCGFYCESNTDAFSAARGDCIDVTLSMVNRSDHQIVLKNITTLGMENIDTSLVNNHLFEVKKKYCLSKTVAISHPYWLAQENNGNIFTVDNQEMIGMPQNFPAMEIKYQIEIEGEIFTRTIPVNYKWRDRIHGELYRPFVITPEVMCNLNQKVYIFSDDKSQNISVELKAGTDSISGNLKLKLPDGWSCIPEYIPFMLNSKNELKTLNFEIHPGNQNGVGTVSAIAEVNGIKMNNSYHEINYDHIQSQILFPLAVSKLEKIDLVKSDKKIGYIEGAGDDVAESLSQSGYDLMQLDEKDFNSGNFKSKDVIITGVRAYNTEKWLINNHEQLMKFVEEGGVFIVQYNTTWGLLSDKIGPYPFKISQDRVTVEDAKVTFVDPSHRVLNFPNKLTENDFSWWIQERGLYFASEWDANYKPVLSWNDPGEESLQGSLLVAQYGKGYFIYTGISFFRQLPAGVPGAFRIFTNMIELKTE